jgi:ribose transport system ATP-binding protein
MSAFVAERLDKSFPGVRALSAASLRLEAGSVHALLGENGAGKSTLIKLMTGVYRPDAGRMLVNGDPVAFHTPLDAAVELDPDAPVTGLSVAQRQLVEIAKALALESGVLLLDEPTASITPDEADRLFGVVRRLASQGKAILFVSHKLEEVFALCDTATVLRDGRSVLEGGALADYDKDAIVDELAREGLALLLISSDLPEMITLADWIVVMRDYRVQGELANDHRYDEMSQAVIRMIHADAREAAA